MQMYQTTAEHSSKMLCLNRQDLPNIMMVGYVGSSSRTVVGKSPTSLPGMLKRTDSAHR
jgi:hypothetical protein